MIISFLATLVSFPNVSAGFSSRCRTCAITAASNILSSNGRWFASPMTRFFTPFCRAFASIPLEKSTPTSSKFRLNERLGYPSGSHSDFEYLPAAVPREEQGCLVERFFRQRLPGIVVDLGSPVEPSRRVHGFAHRATRCQGRCSVKAFKRISSRDLRAAYGLARTAPAPIPGGASPRQGSAGAQRLAAPLPAEPDRDSLDPDLAPIAQLLSLPDGHVVLYRLDGVPARLEGLGTVGRGDRDGDAHLSDRQAAHPVHVSSPRWSPATCA